MTYIKDELCKLASSDMYPLHMPGHKRRLDCDINPYTYDITEIDGFDNLHAAEGIIKEAEERAAALWGAKSKWKYLRYFSSTQCRITEKGTSSDGTKQP